jgi:hypothetical protein
MAIDAQRELSSPQAPLYHTLLSLYSSVAAQFTTPA